MSRAILLGEDRSDRYPHTDSTVAWIRRYYNALFGCSVLLLPNPSHQKSHFISHSVRLNISQKRYMVPLCQPLTARQPAASATYLLLLTLHRRLGSATQLVLLDRFHAR